MDRFFFKQSRETSGQKQSNVTVTNEETKDSEHATTANRQDDGDEVCGESTPAKKRKVRVIQDEHRKFQQKWTEEFLFVLHGSNPLCLLCKQTRSGFKRSNLERHFQTMHTKFNESYPRQSEIRKRKIEQLSSSLSGQQRLIHRTISTAERLTEASFEIAWILARGKKNLLRLRNCKRFLFGFSRNIVCRV